MGVAPVAYLPWLRLSLIPGLTGASWRRLLSTFGSPDDILATPSGILARAVDPALAAAIAAGPEADRLEAALRWAEEDAHAIVVPDDPRYPALLHESPDPPPVLYLAGRIELLAQHAIAIVGSRNATTQGMRNAEQFAHALADAGLTIVSGLALGVDTAAHRGGLAGRCSSIAVLGNGIDIAYPSRNRALRDALIERGLLLSEFALGTPPLAPNFPRRNRIISGLARGCLVVEAALASGSLITARIATELGREVFAIPGSIHSPLAKGCHHLIKQGAKLVERAEDVLEEFGFLPAPSSGAAMATMQSPETEAVLTALGHDPCSVDDLAGRTQLQIDRLLALLLQLQLDGEVELLASGHYQRLA